MRGKLITDTGHLSFVRVLICLHNCSTTEAQRMQQREKSAGTTEQSEVFINCILFCELFYLRGAKSGNLCQLAAWVYATTGIDP